MLQSCGRLSERHEASSKPGASAPGESDLRKRQSASNKVMVRAGSGAEYPKTVTRQSAAGRLLQSFIEATDYGPVQDSFAIGKAIHVVVSSCKTARYTVLYTKTS